MRVVVVEAPKKVHTLEKILGSDFMVLATGGHIKDLPPDKLAVDVADNFAVEYSLLPRKESVVVQLNKAKSYDVLICTDADREGERIGAHVANILGIPLTKAARVTYGNLSPATVLTALKSPRQFDMNLLDAQEARRVVDRLMGYLISKWLWKMGDIMQTRLKAAGRVQSAVLNLIVKREETIKTFVPVTHYLLKLKKMADLLNKDAMEGIQVQKVNDKFEEVRYSSLLDINLALEEFKSRAEPLKLYSKTEKVDTVFPPPALITSSLIKQASTLFGYAPEKIMTVAQALYADGRISYIRTDNPNVSGEFVDMAKAWFKSKSADGIMGDSIKTFKAPEGAQEAHEAIRPTDLGFNYEGLAQDQRNVYELILIRALLSVCAPAKLNKEVSIFECGKLFFRFNGIKIEQLGWHTFGDLFPQFKPLFCKLFTPPKAISITDDLSGLVPLQYPITSQCPPRYTVATLTEEMEKLEIGRPSTYVAVFVTLDRHKYIQYTKQKSIEPTLEGQQAIKMLRVAFAPFIEADYTKKVEAELDDIAAGRLSKETFLNLWYHDFVGFYDKAMDTVSQMLASRPTVPTA